MCSSFRCVRSGEDSIVAIEEVLRRVVGAIADEGFGVDHEPRLPLGPQHIARVTSRSEQHVVG